MAQIKQDIIIITISRLVKNEGKLTELDSTDLCSTLESVACELVPEGAIVEVDKG